MLCHCLLAGVQFVAEGTLVVFLLEGGIVGMLLLVHSEIGLSGVALVTDITLKGFLTCVNSSVAFIFPCLQKKRKYQ